MYLACRAQTVQSTLTLCSRTDAHTNVRWGRKKPLPLPRSGRRNLRRSKSPRRCRRRTGGSHCTSPTSSCTPCRSGTASAKQTTRTDSTVKSGEGEKEKGADTGGSLCTCPTSSCTPCRPGIASVKHRTGRQYSQGRRKKKRNRADTCPTSSCTPCRRGIASRSRATATDSLAFWGCWGRCSDTVQGCSGTVQYCTGSPVKVVYSLCRFCHSRTARRLR